MLESDISVVDTISMEILMHRDAHFGGSFDIMIEYYTREGVGTMPDFKTDEIIKLQLLEKEMKKDLSTLYLPQAALDLVSASKKLYGTLREVYEKSRKETLPRLISDLILTEEEWPHTEIEALVKRGKESTTELIKLLSSPTFYDPLFPGYGRTPIFAAKCLGSIQDPRAIPPLFEALGEDNFFTDEEIIKALATFGDKGVAFLLKRLVQEPFSKDNEYAAIALSGFSENEQIAQICLKLLEKEQVRQRPFFANYLIFACSNLTTAVDQGRFIKITQQKGLPSTLLKEMESVIKSWKKSI